MVKPQLFNLFSELDILKLGRLYVVFQLQNSLLTPGLGGLQSAGDLIKHPQLAGHLLQLLLRDNTT